MSELGITLESDKNNLNINHKNKPENAIDRNITLKRKFNKLFTENRTVKNVEEGIQLKDGAKLIQQKCRPISIHSQTAVKKEIEKLKRQSHIESKKQIR